MKEMEIDMGGPKRCKNGQSCWAKNPPSKPNRQVAKRQKEIQRMQKRK